MKILNSLYRWLLQDVAGGLIYRHLLKNVDKYTKVAFTDRPTKVIYPQRLKLHALFMIVLLMGGLGVLVGSLLTQYYAESSAKPITSTVKSRYCDGTEFTNPQEVIQGLSNPELQLRQAMCHRLFRRPAGTNIYFDYQRNFDYPEPATDATLTYINLDEDPKKEAIIKLTYWCTPLAIVMQQDLCGWHVVAILSPWLGQGFKDTLDQDWLVPVSLINPQSNELLLKQSWGDNLTYQRRLLILKLIQGQLVKVGELEDCTIKPVNHYSEKGWPNTKTYRWATYDFQNSTYKSLNSITYTILGSITYTINEETVEYANVTPAENYQSALNGCLVTDHWRNRYKITQRKLPSLTSILEWDALQQRFVKSFQLETAHNNQTRLIP